MPGGVSSQFSTAVIGGLTIFVVLLVPVLVVQYRRFGRLSLIRILAVSAVCVYAVAVIAYTLLPLPSSLSCGPGGGARRQLVPFMFVRDIARETAGLGVLGTLTSRATLQVIFNVALFVPFGLLVRRLGSRSLVVTTGLAFLLTLAVELTQGTALWGLYDCPYRVADVDDLMANTLGGFLGALLAPRLLAWVPQPGDLTPQRRRPRPVSVGRRWLGMLLDLVIFTATTAVVLFVLRVARSLLGFSPPPQDGWAALPAIVAGLGCVVLPALLGTGASWGQRLVWLTPVWDGPPSRGRRLLRAVVIGGTWTVAMAATAVVDPEGPFFYPALALTLPALVSPFVVLGSRRGLSGLITGARMADSRAVDRATPADTVAEPH